MISQSPCAVKQTITHCYQVSRLRIDLQDDKAEPSVCQTVAPKLDCWLQLNKADASHDIYSEIIIIINKLYSMEPFRTFEVTLQHLKQKYNHTNIMIGDKM